MTHPLVEKIDDELGRFITVPDGFTVDLLQMLSRGGVTFYRQATPGGHGGGFVAETSYVPPHIAIPWDCVVYENTRVFDNADLASAGTRIVGNVYRVSEILRSKDFPLLRQAARRRRQLHLEWRKTAMTIPRYDIPRFANGSPRGFS